MNNKHERCPFCDGTGRQHPEKFVHLKRIRWIACNKCGAKTNFYKNIKDAWGAWDKRVEQKEKK